MQAYKMANGEDFDLGDFAFDVGGQAVGDYIFSKAGGKLSTLGKKAKEKALAQQAQKKNNEVKKIPRKYIQVATLSSEAAARSAVSKLGGSFSYQKIAGKGKTLYVIVSVSTDNQATLSSLENQVKSKLPSSKYIVRTAGK